MKILIAHNRYKSQQPSGENVAVETDSQLLIDHGVEVRTVTPSSDQIDQLPLFARLMIPASPVYFPNGIKEIDRQLSDFRPDVLHVHNVVPLLSPMIVRKAHALGIAVVHTAHNYRHGCVAGTHLRHGQVCVMCHGGLSNVNGIVHSCYRGSALQSLTMVAGQLLHRRTWHSCEAVIALTPFMRQYLIGLGFAEERIFLRGTPTRGPHSAQAVRDPDGPILFLGRLAAEKGLDTLLDAWGLLSPLERAIGLWILGDGPLRPVAESAARQDKSIRVLGQLPHDQTSDITRRSSALVLPSKWWEGFPVAVAEAFAWCLPVIATRGGSVATVVGDSRGWLVDGDSPSQLADAIRRSRGPEASIHAANARRYYEQELEPRVATRRLLDIYETAIAYRESTRDFDL